MRPDEMALKNHFVSDELQEKKTVLNVVGC